MQLPGSQYVDPRSAMSQRMIQQGMDTSPVQHWTQGLARLASALIGAHLQKNMMGDESAASKALMKGLMGTEQTYDPTGAGPVGGQPQTYQQPGSFAAAAQNLQGLEGNPYAGRMAQQLMMQQAVSRIEAQQKAADMAKQFEYAKLLKSAPGEAPQTADITNYEYAKKTGATTLSFDDWKKSATSQGQETFGNTPIWGTDAQGNPVLMQPSNRGGVKAVQMPPGVTAMRGQTSRVDLGDKFAVLDANGAIIGYMPKGIGAERKVDNGQVIGLPPIPGAPIPGQMPGPMSRPAPGFNPNALPPVPSPGGAPMPGAAPAVPPLVPATTPGAAGPGAAPAIPPGVTVSNLPPTPADIAKAEADRKKDALAQAQKNKYASIVNDEIGRAKKLISDASFPVTGFWGKTASNVWGNPAYDLSQLLVTIKGNSGFDRLQEMRSASKTGAALGPVSDFENKTLQATIGSLEQAQSKEQLLYNLDRVQKVYNKIINEGLKPGDPLLEGLTIPGGPLPGQPIAAPSPGGGIKFLGYE